MCRFFFCLLTNNKRLTKDNSTKRRSVKDATCLFCSELESIFHLFPKCCVAMRICNLISELMLINLGPDFELVACLWIVNKKHIVTNIVVTYVVLWCLRKLQNDL